MSKYAIVLNKYAGSVRGREGGAIANWIQDQHDNPNLHLVKPKQIDATLKKLQQEGVTRIALGGGDGTLSRSAEFFVENNLELVPLPLGTLNHFARDLGIASEPDRWLETIRNGCRQSVDVGLVNERMFLNNFSIGLYPRLVRERQTLNNERLLGSKKPRKVI